MPGVSKRTPASHRSLREMQELRKREACDAILEDPDHYPPMAVQWARRFSVEYDGRGLEEFRLTPGGSLRR